MSRRSRRLRQRGVTAVRVRTRRVTGRRSIHGAALLLAAATVLALGQHAQQQAITTTPGPSLGAPTDPVTVDLLARLPVGPELARSGYEREAFGDGWATDPAGCSTREHVLITESHTPATLAEACTVTRGEWVSLYDDHTTRDPHDLDIDHLVALAEAWESGAATWSQQRREAFANDLTRPDGLIAVTTASNRSKGDRDPAEWLPPNRQARCRYAHAWATQKAAWSLSIDPAEHSALAAVLAGCPTTVEGAP